MQLGELFITLGTKGGDKAAKDISSIRVGLADAKSMALETKAAILGLLYELGKFSSQSIAMGQGLQQFGNLTGLSPEALQKWQYALQQSGVSADETANSVKHLQDVTNDIILNGNIPNGFKVIAESVQLDPSRLRDTFYVLDKFREYARAHRDNPDITRSLLAPTIGNDKVIQALMTGTFDPAKTPRNQLYSAGQTKALNADAIALKNLGTAWEHFLGKLTAEHGMEFIHDLNALSLNMIAWINALDGLGGKLGVFKEVDEIIKDAVTDSGAMLDLFKKLQGTNPKGITHKFALPTFFDHIPGPVGKLSRAIHSQSVTNNINTTVTGAEPVSKEEIDGHLNKAVNRAARSVTTPQQN